MNNIGDYWGGIRNWSVPFWGLVPWPFAGLILFVLIAWSLYWKGRALWKAARREDFWWFIALLVMNTAGILEILYIYIFSEKSEKKLKQTENKEEIKKGL